MKMREEWRRIVDGWGNLYYNIIMYLEPRQIARVAGEVIPLDRPMAELLTFK